MSAIFSTSVDEIGRAQTDLVWLLLAAGAIAAAASTILTPLTGKLARRFGILDRPGAGAHKQHASPTPYLGGIAIMAGFVLSTIGIALLTGRSINIDGPFLGIIAAVMLGIVGVADDIRPLPRIVRLGAQLIAAAAAWVTGFSVQIVDAEFVNFVVTIIWILGITNAFNLLDNMDGLSAGLAGVGALSFGVLAIIEDMPGLVVTAGALAGAAFGFLIHNRHPARSFMGDAGSLFIGYLLALIGIKLRFDNLMGITFLVPVVVLGIPIFDTTLVILSRARHKKPLFQGARDHVSHRLARIGFPVRVAVGLLYWAGICLGWLGIVISRSNEEVGWMLLAFVSAMGIFFGVLLWEVPVYQEGRRPEGREPGPRQRRPPGIRRDEPSLRSPVMPPAQTDPERVARKNDTGALETIGFVGPSGARLFSVTHEPAGVPKLGVVVCSSVHAELLKNYRKEVILGRALADLGVAVQRFNYLGAGNSDGLGPETTFDTMLEGTLAQVEHLKQRTGVENIVFLGTRLGAIVAAAAARQLGNTPLILWDPIKDRRTFFREMFRSSLMMEVRGTDKKPRTSEQMMEALLRDGNLDLLGYRIDIDLYNSFENRTLESEVGASPGPMLVLQIVRGGELRRDLKELVGRWEAAGASVQTGTVDSDEAWWFSSKPWQPEENLVGVETLVQSTTTWVAEVAGRVGTPT